MRAYDHFLKKIIYLGNRTLVFIVCYFDLTYIDQVQLLHTKKRHQCPWNVSKATHFKSNRIELQLL